MNVLMAGLPLQLSSISQDPEAVHAAAQAAASSFRKTHEIICVLNLILLTIYIPSMLELLIWLLKFRF